MCGDHNIVNADKDESDDWNMESQDEGDMGHGACPTMDKSNPQAGDTNLLEINEAELSLDLHLQSLSPLTGPSSPLSPGV